MTKLIIALAAAAALAACTPSSLPHLASQTHSVRPQGGSGGGPSGGGCTLSCGAVVTPASPTPTP